MSALRELTDRHKCNRISGCPPATSVLSHGPDAVEPILKLLAANPRANGYWVTKLIQLLGQIESPAVIAPLERMLSDKRWDVPIRAAQSLGRRKSSGSLSALTTLLERANKDKNVALSGAARYALSQVSPDPRTHRKALADLVPATSGALGAIPAPVLDILIELVRDARLPHALPGVRQAALHTNRFVREQALLTLAALQDTGGVPFALHRLDDPLPSIRRQALATLQRITGIRTMHNITQWRAWAKRHKMDVIPAEKE